MKLWFCPVTRWALGIQNGRLLMKSFVYAVTELEELPAKVLLYNSGVKLAVKGADTLKTCASSPPREWRL